MKPCMVTIVIDNRLRMRCSELPDETLAELRRAHTYLNPAHKKMKRLAAQHPRGKWMKNTEVERLHTFTEDVATDTFTLPRGSMQRLREALKGAGLGWHVVDQRTRGAGPKFGRQLVHRPNPNDPAGGELRWYQREAIEAALAKQQGLIRAPTGSGKTTTAIGLIARIGLPTLVVLWTSGLYKQWEERLRDELGLGPDEVGHLGAGKREIRPVTLAMQQTLARGIPKALAGQFGLVLADEVQRFAASTFQKVIDAFPAQYRIGVSADETRRDGKEFLTYDVFGNVLHEVTQDQLIAEGSVLDVECRVLPTEFRADWYVEQRERNLLPDGNRLLDELTVDEERNRLALEVVVTEVQRGHQMLVLSQRVEHCRALHARLKGLGLTAGLMLGGAENRPEYDETVARMKAGAIRVGVGTVQAIGTGIDIPAVGRGVLVTPISGNRQLYGQIRGRLCRPGKEEAALYVLWDQHVHGATILAHLAKWNRAMWVAEGGSWTEGRLFSKTWKPRDEETHGEPQRQQGSDAGAAL